MVAIVNAKNRLDNELTRRGLVTSRSQAESWIKLGKVTVDGRVVTKSGVFVSENSKIELTASEQYVSRAGLKLASVARLLKLDFRGKTVLDVGSSTGGFTDYALRNGASKVYAVDVGTDQLHPSLRGDKRIELYEKTDIRDFTPDEKPDIVLMDVSFISVREILPHILDLRKTSPSSGASSTNSKPILSGGGEPIGSQTTEKLVLGGDSVSGSAGILSKSSKVKITNPISHFPPPNPQVVIMVKPQFEAGKGQTNKGIIKNDSIRRKILSDFEDWSKQYFVIIDKRDSDVAGAKGNQERFYLLNML
jgi:TlyA family rRNA methyltransferase/putative hemolysin